MSNKGNPENVWTERFLTHLVVSDFGRFMLELDHYAVLCANAGTSLR
jgi:hypothetical protein